MNTLNRIVIVLGLLVLMVVCSVSLVAPLRVFSFVESQAGAFVEFLDDLRDFVRLGGGILFALVVDIILVLVLILEVRRPKRKAIRVQKAAGGEVMIRVDSIAERLEYELDQMPSVLNVKADISAKGGGVAVVLDVNAAAGINVPEKADEIVEKTTSVIEDNLGLKIARPPKVNMRVVPHPKGLRPVESQRRPSPVEPPEETPSPSEAPEA